MKQANVTTNLPPGTPIRVVAKPDKYDVPGTSPMFYVDDWGRFSVEFDDHTPFCGARSNLLAAGYQELEFAFNVPATPGAGEAMVGIPPNEVPLGRLELVEGPNSFDVAL